MTTRTIKGVLNEAAAEGYLELDDQLDLLHELAILQTDALAMQHLRASPQPMPIDARLREAGLYSLADAVDLLRAQLAARDAALDAVLAFSDYGDVAQLKAILAAQHGVHPK